MCVHISINIVYIYNIMVIIVDSMIRSRSRWQDTSLSRALSEYSWCKSRPWDASATRALVDTSLLWFARVHFLICGLLVCLWQVKTYHVMSRHVLSFSSSIFLHKWLIVGQHRRRWWTELSLSMTRRKPSGVCDFPQCLGGATVDGDISKDLEEIVG